MKLELLRKKLELNRLDLKDKRLLPAAAFVVLVILLILFYRWEASAERRLAGLKSGEKEFYSLKQDYIRLKAATDELDRRAALSQGGVVKSINDVFGSMGLMSKLASLKPMETKNEDEFIREDAEISVKNADLNEMLNILYRLENAHALIAIRNVDIRTSFSAPTVDMRLVISEYRKK